MAEEALATVLVLEPQLPPNAILGARGPMIGADGVISMSVVGSFPRGRVWVSTYRGRPPGREELEEVSTFNVTQSHHGTPVWTDTEVSRQRRTCSGQGYLRASERPLQQQPLGHPALRP